MKHFPANCLQIVAPCEDMSTPDRAHGLCLEDDFLAVPVLDESIASKVAGRFRLNWPGGKTSDAEVKIQKAARQAQASTTRTSEAQAMDNRPATTGTDRTPAAARNYNLVVGERIAKSLGLRVLTRGNASHRVAFSIVLEKAPDYGCGPHVNQHTTAPAYVHQSPVNIGD